MSDLADWERALLYGDPSKVADTTKKGDQRMTQPIDIGVLRSAVRLSTAFEAAINQPVADEADAWVGEARIQLLQPYDDHEVGWLIYNHEYESFEFHPTERKHTQRDTEETP